MARMVRTGRASPMGRSRDAQDLAAGSRSPAATGGGVRAAVARMRSLWRDMTGESAYERYLARHAREHPGCAPMSSREFWRARSRLTEESISTGCC